MTIGFSKDWAHDSWSKRGDGSLSQEHEKAWIEYMIHHCDSATVKEYAASEPDLLHGDTGKAVYVRTGIHVSRSEPQLHVQAVLGSNDPDCWKQGGASGGYTAHILWGEGNGPFRVDLFSGQPHLKPAGAP